MSYNEYMHTMHDGKIIKIIYYETTICVCGIIDLRIRILYYIMWCSIAIGAIFCSSVHAKMAYNKQLPFPSGYFHSSGNLIVGIYYKFVQFKHVPERFMFTS